MRDEVASDDAFIDRAQIDASLIAKDGLYVVFVEDPREDADVIEIEFKKVLGAGCD
jgi:hypothetical protein